LNDIADDKEILIGLLKNKKMKFVKVEVNKLSIRKNIIILSHNYPFYLSITSILQAISVSAIFPGFSVHIKKALSSQRKSWKDKPRFSGFIFPQNMKYGKRIVSSNNKSNVFEGGE
jgi:hypothetical protein